MPAAEGRPLQVILATPGQPDPESSTAPSGGAKTSNPATGGTASAPWLILPPLAVLALAVFAWRRRRRSCPSCGAAMERLDRIATFAELDLKERAEQLVGDVHYQIWRCLACRETVKKGTARPEAALPPTRSPLGLRRRL